MSGKDDDTAQRIWTIRETIRDLIQASRSQHRFWVVWWSFVSISERLDSVEQCEEA
jgi:hypothetical protein